MNLKACIGIISWFPNKELDRKLRIDRFNRLLKQLEEYFPTTPLLVIAQNWGDYSPKLPKNSKVISFENGLGILGARKELFKQFKSTDYNYIVLFDDDAIIKTTKETCDEYLKIMENNPNGFCFLQYEASQLSGCALSKSIVEKEDMVNVDASKREGYEDTIYAHLLKYKYPTFEFKAPTNIECIHFQNKEEVAPSTWCDCNDREFEKLTFITYKILDEFKNGNFDVDSLKKKYLDDWNFNWTKYSTYYNWMGWN